TVIGGPFDVEKASPIAPSTAPLMVPPEAAAAVLLPPACEAWRFWLSKLLSGLLLVGGGGAQFVVKAVVGVGPSPHGAALPISGAKLVNANAAMPLSNSFFKSSPTLLLKVRLSGYHRQSAITVASWSQSVISYHAPLSPRCRR